MLRNSKPYLSSAFLLLGVACGNDENVGRTDGGSGGATQSGSGLEGSDGAGSSGERGGSADDDGAEGSGDAGATSTTGTSGSGANATASADNGDATAGTTAADGDSTSSSSSSGASSSSSSSSGGTTAGVGPCGGCPANFVCRYDTCVPDLGGCVTHDDCPGDSYCDDNSECIPYGTPPEVTNDPECERTEVPAGVTPVVQCEWEVDPMDPTASSYLVYTTPLVADLNLDGDPNKLQPSVVLTTWQSDAMVDRLGTLRVFDGRTCEEQMRIGGDDDPNVAETRPAYGAHMAIVDLNNDVASGGHPEIVGLHRPGLASNEPIELIAYEIDSTGPSPVLRKLWGGQDCVMATPVTFSHQSSINSVVVADIVGDDGIPEIAIDTYVFDADGCVLNAAQIDPTARNMDAVVDVDLDGAMDLVRANELAGWDAGMNQWVRKPYFTPTGTPGSFEYIAVADAGDYSSLMGSTLDYPEVFIVARGEVRLQRIDGSIAWGPLPVYAEPMATVGLGGPPTASDFDGDGWPEFAAAGATQYAVYDPDCDPGGAPLERPGGACDRDPAMAGLPDGVLWAQPSQDASSNRTGSSIFDFDGDGDSEAVYRDECYIRVYDGKTGAVVFSASGSSFTGTENAIVVDVDGDFASEIVVPRASGPGCPSPDPLFPTSGDYETKGGFVIYRDPEDRWANSRPIWNQHAYSITHINDDATIPNASATEANWLTPGLNNFRQNSQGNLGILPLADLTVELSDISELCAGNPGPLDLEAVVCNRGTDPVQDGVAVSFQETPMAGGDINDAVEICAAVTTRLLQPGDCETITCNATVNGVGNVFVRVDPNDLVADCHPGNNDGAGSFRICPG